MTVLSTGPKFCIAKIEGESGHHQLRVDEEYTLDVCGHRVGVTLIPRPGAARLAFDLARDVFAFRAELPEPARAAMRGKCRK